MTDQSLLLKLRQETGLGVMDIKRALTEAVGDETKARAILQTKGEAVRVKRAEKEAKQGVIDAYCHDGRIGVLVELNCETDFVARNEEFRAFAHDLALQVSAMNPATVEELLAQEFIKDSGQTIGQRLDDLTAKTGEKIVINRFTRFALRYTEEK